MEDIGLYVAVAVGVVLLIVVIVLFNQLVRARNAMRQARHGIEVALTQRHDLLTKQMQVVPEAVRSEQAFQEKVTAMRLPRPAEQMSVAEMEQADRAMDRAQQALNVTAEAYPEFRSSAAFAQLQDSVRYTEEQLSASRRSYNAGGRPAGRPPADVPLEHRRPALRLPLLAHVPGTGA